MMKLTNTLIAPETSSFLLSVMRKFLLNKISFDDARDIFLTHFRSSRPIEHLKEIVDESRQMVPIPTPPQDVSIPKKLRHWTQHEDTRLLAGVYIYGSLDWTKIARFVGAGRGRPQCLQRWTRTLNPQIVKEVWTEEEDKKLLQIVSQYEKVSWTKVANMMGNRSDVQCRYHFSQLMKTKRKRSRDGSSVGTQDPHHISSPSTCSSSSDNETQYQPPLYVQRPIQQQPPQPQPQQYTPVPLQQHFIPQQQQQSLPIQTQQIQQPSQQYIMYNTLAPSLPIYEAQPAKIVTTVSQATPMNVDAFLSCFSHF